ncbi:hypothetical protein SAMN04488128_101227 [Chitinophaga eiseniae]|uniref:DUF6538 domain-containing protein n=1 Tax=Chitinophaga eiseniae TaxID=634771 RepID=A0A1T4KNT6_9BACT|nr:DUF6538 domain-containing protein [Chitinophaga eiseniae]SJZ44028.1 hypothetical protein SAMN04488128_101227 [Chitinophaga eiseniae]
MNFLLNKSGRYYYNRRVPKIFKEYDPRRFVRLALRTDSRKAAIKLAIAQNDRLEAYWKALVATGEKHSDNHYRSLVDRARLLGFSYHEPEAVAALPLEEILKRVGHIEKNYTHKHTEAVLGSVSAPAVKLDDALTRFWGYSRDKVLNKSPNQIRKWRNPRKKAIRNFIHCVGNKPLHELTREDTLAFRDWWIDRMDKEELVSGSANKDLIYIKMIVTTVAENLKIDIDTEHLFKKLVLSKDDGQKRLPFTTDFISSTLLNPDNLKGLNVQARYVLYAFAETGAGLAELTGLLPEDIILDAPIPYIAIVPRQKRALKTKFRARTIPLVGYALEAFKACPDGFTHYRDRPDALSGILAKYLRENNLLPSRQHAVYSLRHSFQDRILSVNCPDRIQADLMGHKFGRPAYGEGATLAHKLEWLKKIQLKPES